jgi:hypothetical protein
MEALGAIDHPGEGGAHQIAIFDNGNLNWHLLSGSLTEKRDCLQFNRPLDVRKKHSAREKAYKKLLEYIQ